VIESRVAVLAANRFSVQLGDQTLAIEALNPTTGVYQINGNRLRARVVTTDQQVSVFAERGYHFAIVDPLVAADQDQQGGDAVAAPMSGLVKLVSASAGAEVAEGDAIVVMEAMKMEHTLRAPRDGVLGELTVVAGDQVDEGDLMFSMVPVEGEQSAG
jgi:3-methylcrotonyl-CoA carboxylase alpha subunit